MADNTPAILPKPEIVQSSGQHSLADIRDMAVAVAKSRLFDLDSPEQAMTLMLLCQAEGLHPIQAMRVYHIIKGKPSKKADAMLAEFQRRGGKVKWVDFTDAKVSAVFTHPTACPDGQLVDWDLNRAKTAGLMNNDNWRKYPRNMLRARVISDGVRMVLPEVVVGMYTPEEVQDFASEPSERDEARSAKNRGMWAKLQEAPATNEPPPQEEFPPAEVYEQPPPSASKQRRAAAVLAPIPDDCRMIPADIIALKRQLASFAGKAFNDYTEAELAAAEKVVDEMAAGAKDQNNKLQLSVLVSFLRAESDRRKAGAA